MDDLFDEPSVFEAPAAAEHEPVGDQAATGTAPRRNRRNRRRVRTWVVAVIVLALVGAPGYLLVSRLVGGSDAAEAGALVEHGLAAHRAGKVQEAFGLYRDAVRIDPKNKYAHYNLGLIAQTSGDQASAEREYRITLALDERFSGAMFNLAIIRTGAGALQEARDLYRRVIAIEPRNAGAHLNLGFVLLKLSAKAEAKAEFAEAVRLDPTAASRVPPEAR